MDANRLDQFNQTKRAYDEFPQEKEFIIPTRNAKSVGIYLKKNNLMKDVRIIPYIHDIGFNPSKALNIGVRNAHYDNIIITSPEVKPITNALEQLSESLGKNVICEVSDQDQYGNLTLLVSEAYRDSDPSMYFLAMFNKKDIETVNGWDEDFMAGYAYEDNDFGARWVRAGLPFEFRQDIRAIHQYHPRGETVSGGLEINKRKFQSNNIDDVTYCKNGLNTIL